MGRTEDKSAGQNKVAEGDREAAVVEAKTVEG